MIAPVVASDAIVRQFARHLNLHWSLKGRIVTFVVEIGIHKLNHISFVIGFWVGCHGESNR